MTTRPAKLSATMLSILGDAAPVAARKLSTEDAVLVAVLASEAALAALEVASDLHRKVGSKTTLAARDAAERAWEAANEREFAALEAHDGAPVEGAIVAA